MSWKSFCRELLQTRLSTFGRPAIDHERQVVEFPPYRSQAQRKRLLDALAANHATMEGIRLLQDYDARAGRGRHYGMQLSAIIEETPLEAGLVQRTAWSQGRLGPPNKEEVVKALDSLVTPQFKQQMKEEMTRLKESYGGDITPEEAEQHRRLLEVMQQLQEFGMPIHTEVQKIRSNHWFALLDHAPDDIEAIHALAEKHSVVLDANLRKKGRGFKLVMEIVA